MTQANSVLWLKKYYDIILFIACVLFFLTFPQLDLQVASYFYQNGFYFNEYSWVRVIYWTFAKIGGVVALVLLGLIIYFRVNKHAKRMWATVFLFVSLLIGPGLMVNTVLKNNSVGRPRPVHIENFGGQDTFTPVFHYSGACKKNCSFVSGHAAMGFYFIAFFWVFRLRRLFILGLAIGALVSFGRIVQGGHFLSDVIFAGWVVYFTCKVFNYWLSPKWLAPEKE